MDISVVVPLLNEEESLPELLAEVDAVMRAHGYTWEMIMIDDGSTDGSWAMIQKLRAQYPEVRGIRFRRNYGKSPALHVGFQQTRGDIVITMDADLQDRPKHIPEFVAMIREQGFDLVSGWKQKRRDPISKTIPTKIFNGVNRLVSGVRLHDMNCGFKAYRAEVVKSIEIYGEMHRYIPVIAIGAGFKKIGELKVEHIARKYGKTKFGLERFINGFLDLLTITFLTKYNKRPMHFFGLYGFLFGILGGGCMATIYLLKLLGMIGLMAPYYISDHVPLLFLGTVSFILGILLLSTGLLAELIGRSAPGRNDYLIAETLGE
jgi:glycosyltransferase involved in cell wall biosynthesis